MNYKICVLTFVLAACSFFQVNAQYKSENPLAHTYSIVAYDSVTGDMGVAVQSHWFSVGTIVSWGEAGVGAIATQSFANPAYGPEGLALLKSGLNAQETLDSLLSNDEGRDYRQVGIIDAKGLAASHTGAKNIKAAGNIVGKYYAVQANMMLNSTVWQAMADAFENTDGDLAERMVAALEAAQNEKGDIRGKQSAALLVVSGKSTGKVWMDRKVDLRVDDAVNPVAEIKRLLKVKQAYDFMNAGDLDIEAGNYKSASENYGKAESMFPENLEMKYWHAINLANEGKVEEALPMFKLIFKKDSNWRELTRRLITPGVLVVSKEDLEKIISQ